MTVEASPVGFAVHVSPFVWAIIGLLALVGIAIAWWKFSEAAERVPWEIVVPVAALFAAGLAIWAVALGR